MTMRIEALDCKQDLTEFLGFHDRVFDALPASWPSFVDFERAALDPDGPFARERLLRPMVVRDRGEIVARAIAVMDARYNRHWGHTHDRLGHLIFFEALPDTRDAVRLLLDAGCEWLATQGAVAARVGFGLLDLPFVIDAYESLPPFILRHNPPHYHGFLKDAGFETEKGFVDYKIRVTPELIARYESALEAARRGGFEVVPLRDVPPAKRVKPFTETWNETFSAHWGLTPYDEAEVALLLTIQEPMGVLDTSAFAMSDGEIAGLIWVLPELSAFARLRPGRVLRDDEKLNFLGIGVRQAARGRGVNLALAGFSFLELIRRGATYLSYTFVLDDNWPSRRTAEKLGATVCASYLAYRRNFRHA